MLKRYKKSQLFAILVIIFLSSCGYYSFKGALPSYIKSVAVPLFNDRTSYPGVRENLTNRVTDGFITDNTLKVVDETKADIILTGTINSITQRAAMVSSNEAVSEYKIIVSVSVKCEDVKMSKIMFKKNIQQYGLMDADAGLDERTNAIEVALELITDEIINSTLGGW